ncbi:MAG: hypothetical protein Q8K45_18540 [Rubrivivax sp.]|nr:hypothetical protein [Rubrivivax sp.]
MPRTAAACATSGARPAGWACHDALELDLLFDLWRQAKAAAYLAVASPCWYVLREGGGDAQELLGESAPPSRRAAGLAL